MNITSIRAYASVSTIIDYSPNTSPTLDWRQGVPGSGNYTKQQLRQAYTFYVIGYLCLLALCNIGNLLNLIVITGRRRKSSVHCYMLASTIANLGVLWFAFPVFLWNMSATFKLPYYTPTNKIITHKIRGPALWMHETCIHLADWILLVFSLERLLVIIKPFRFEKLQDPKVARLIIAVLTVMAGTFRAHDIASHVFCEKYNVTGQPCPRPNWLASWKSLQELADVSMSMLVFIVLSIENIILVAFIAKQQRTDVGRMREEQKRASDSSTTSRHKYSNLVIVSTSMLYLVTRFPSIVYHCLILADSYQVYHFATSAQQFAAPFVNVPLYANYSLTFLLYMLTNAQFRTSFKRIILSVYQRKIWKLSGRKSLITITSSYRASGRSLGHQMECKTFRSTAYRNLNNGKRHNSA